jgi:hypothetical protein
MPANKLILVFDRNSPGVRGFYSDQPVTGGDHDKSNL